MRTVFLLLALALGLLADGRRPAGADQPNAAGVERYAYEALPLGNEDRSGAERIEIELARTTDGQRYAMRTESPGEVEEITLLLDREHRVLSGERRQRRTPGSGATIDKVRIDPQFAYVEGGSSGKAARLRLPQGGMTAVDGSLLVLLRDFPFDSTGEWSVFMVDFSAASVTITVRQEGQETVTVPAGTFACYRMEATVGIPLLRPRILYWLTKEEPHFLVKQQGKRGPFTRSYVTSLTKL